MATYNEITLVETLYPEIVIVEASPKVITIVENVGLPGRDGVDGVSGGTSNIVSILADIALGGHRAVIETSTGVTYADNTISEHKWKVLGITLGAGGIGANVNVQFSGVITEPSWTFTPDMPIYLSTNGLLTQTIPTIGFIFTLGIALTPTSMLYNPLTPIDTL